MCDGRRDMPARIVKHIADTRDRSKDAVTGLNMRYFRACPLHAPDFLIAGYVRKRHSVISLTWRVPADAFATNERTFGAIADPGVLDSNNDIMRAGIRYGDTLKFHMTRSCCHNRLRLHKNCAFQNRDFAAL